MGATITFGFLTNDMVPPPGMITALSPPQLFAFDWGDEQIRFELQPAGEFGSPGTLLRFEHRFGDPTGAAKFAAGWEVRFEMLDALLADELPAPFRERWEELYRDYAAAFAGIDRRV